MAKLRGNILFIGTIGNICFYRAHGQGYARVVSSLTGKRVKTDKAFRRTMENAGVLAKASRIGSRVYRALPESFRQFWMYRAFTGEAIQLLRQGKTDEETCQVLWKTYAEVWANKDVMTPEKPRGKRINRPKGISVTRKPRKKTLESPLPLIFDLLGYQLPPVRRGTTRRTLDDKGHHETPANKQPAPS